MIEDHQGDGDAAQRLHQRRGDRADALRPLDQSVEALDEALRALRLIGLHAIGLDVPRALEGLVEQGGELAKLALGVGGDAPHAPSDADHRADGDGEDDEGDQRQQPILIEHQRDEESRRHRLLADAGKHGRGGAAQHGGVVREARDQAAGGIGVEIGEVGPHQPGEQGELDIGDNALADRGHQHRLPVAGKPLDQRQRHHSERDQP